MARTIKHVNLETPTARRRLRTGRNVHWQTIIPKQAHIGWQRWPDDPCGRWILRRFIGGKYSIIELGKADDAADADGSSVLDYAQARHVASKMLASPGRTISRMTVRQAYERYRAHKEALGQPIDDLRSRVTVHILPTLGDLVIEELDPARLRRWLADMAALPAQSRPTADGKLQWRPAPKTDEQKRARKNTANRVAAILKAILNFAYDEGHVTSNDAWGRKLKLLPNVATARLRYLELDECQRLLNTCAPEFRALVRAALETGCRYSELTRLQVRDFNKSAGTITIAKSKTGKIRHIVLTEDGISFFKQQCIGRDGSEFMFTTGGRPWTKSGQQKPMIEACHAARIKPRMSFHGLRHTWASLAVMTERHYWSSRRT
jgi:integrase